MGDHIYNSWTEDHELILKQIAEKSSCYRYINFECYNHYKKILYFENNKQELELDKSNILIPSRGFVTIKVYF